MALRRKVGSPGESSFTSPRFRRRPEAAERGFRDAQGGHTYIRPFSERRGRYEVSARNCSDKQGDGPARRVYEFLNLFGNSFSPRRRLCHERSDARVSCLAPSTGWALRNQASCEPVHVPPKEVMGPCPSLEPGPRDRDSLRRKKGFP